LFRGICTRSTFDGRWLHTCSYRLLQMYATFRQGLAASSWARGGNEDITADHLSGEGNLNCGESSPTYPQFSTNIVSCFNTQLPALNSMLCPSNSSRQSNAFAPWHRSMPISEFRTICIPYFPLSANVFSPIATLHLLSIHNTYNP